MFARSYVWTQKLVSSNYYVVLDNIATITMKNKRKTLENKTITRKTETRKRPKCKKNEKKPKFILDPFL